MSGQNHMVDDTTQTHMFNLFPLAVQNRSVFSIL